MSVTSVRIRGCPTKFKGIEMVDSFEIGSCPERICSATNLPNIPDGADYRISANRVSFWCTHNLFQTITFKVFKGTPEYTHIYEAYTDGGFEYLSDYLLGLVMKHADVTLIRHALDKNRTHDYNDGEANAKRVMRAALGL